MKFKYILIIQIILLFGCKSYKVGEFEKSTPKKYILLNDNFINSIGNEIKKSRTIIIEKEKKEFINRNVNDLEYFKNYNTDYQINFRDDFFNTAFLDLVNSKLRNRKVNNLYFIHILLSGEKISYHDFVLIEDSNYKDELFYYGSYLSKKFVYKEIDSELIDFTHEFMINLPYSFENNIVFISDQSLIIDRVSATRKNKYEVTSVVVPKMLNYQISIFEKFYGLNGNDAEDNSTD